MNHRSPSSRNIASHPTGATLVEVLMSLLIMAIGVTSVFTLFPLAILKAVKANQLTNAKLYEGSIKDTLLGNPQLWTGAPEWKENSAYGTKAYSILTPQDLWVAPRPNGRLLPDTNQIFYCPESNPFISSSVDPGFGGSPSLTSSIRAGGYKNRPSPLPTVSDGAITWTRYFHSPYLADTTGRSSAYIVDPLGWYRVANDPDRFQFGLIQSTDSSTPLYMDRIHCQLSSSTVDQFFRLQDSWSETIETTPVTVTSAAGRVQIMFPPTMDVTNQGSLNRVILTSTLSKKALELPVIAPSYPVVAGFSVLEIDGDLGGFVPDQARIEIQTPGRYSWLMSVHSTQRGIFEAQCAIVFNRSFETLDEQGYRAEFWSTGNSNMAKVRWIYDASSESPRLKEGGYICDSAHGYWYQIQKIETNEERVDASDTPNTAGLYARSILRLSDPVVVQTGDASTPATLSDYLTTNATNDSMAVIIPGVIHVFSFAP